MKSAIISTTILLVIIVLLVINSIILDKCTDSLLSTVNSMSDDPVTEQRNAIDLVERWEKIEPYVSISVVHLETEAVTNAASLIRVYAETGNASEFIAAKKLFSLAVKHISFSGKLSLETIL